MFPGIALVDGAWIRQAGIEVPEAAVYGGVAVKP